MSRVTTYGRDTVTANEFFAISTPKIAPPTPLPPVIFCHGAGSDATAIISLTDSVERIARDVTNAGYTMLACDLGGTGTWGNDTVISRINDAYTYAQTLPGIRTGRVLLLGTSMGGLSSLVWTAGHMGQVHGLAAIIPVIDVNDIHANNRGGFTSAINAAYSGGWSQATYGAAHNPLTIATAGTYAALPMQIHYGTTDAICLPAKAIEFGTKTNSTLLPLAAGHENLAYQSVDTAALIAFFQQF